MNRYKIIKVEENPFDDKFYIKKRFWFTPLFFYIKTGSASERTNLEFTTYTSAHSTIVHWIGIENLPRRKKIITEFKFGI